MLHVNQWYKLLMYISIFFILMLISNLSYVILIGNLYSLLIVIISLVINVIKYWLIDALWIDINVLTSFLLFFKCSLIDLLMDWWLYYIINIGIGLFINW